MTECPNSNYNYNSDWINTRQITNSEANERLDKAEEQLWNISYLFPGSMG